jgi:hypothetical protein
MGFNVCLHVAAAPDLQFPGQNFVVGMEIDMDRLVVRFGCIGDLNFGLLKISTAAF